MRNQRAETQTANDIRIDQKSVVVQLTEPYQLKRYGIDWQSPTCSTERKLCRACPTSYPWYFKFFSLMFMFFHVLSWNWTWLSFTGQLCTLRRNDWFDIPLDKIWPWQDYSWKSICTTSKESTSISQTSKHTIISAFHFFWKCETLKLPQTILHWAICTSMLASPQMWSTS